MTNTQDIKNKNLSSRPMEVSTGKKYFPIEVTTHNIFFHEESPILSADSFESLIATSGTDKVVRLWNCILKDPEYTTNVVRTAENSSVKIEYLRDLIGFQKAVNTVRFKKDKSDWALAGCSDDGKVMFFSENESIVAREANGDDAFVLEWGGDYLFVGFASGNVEVFCITKKETQDGEKAVHTVKFLTKKKITSHPIQGLAFNAMRSTLAAHTLDHILWLYLWDANANKLESMANHRDTIDSTSSIFKRISFIDDNLSCFTKNKTISVYRFPYCMSDLEYKIGPMDTPPARMLCSKNWTAACSKKCVGFIFKGEYAFGVNETCFGGITDGFFLGNTFFVSSTDGFLTSIRLDKVVFSDTQNLQEKSI